MISVEWLSETTVVGCVQTTMKIVDMSSDAPIKTAMSHMGTFGASPPPAIFRPNELSTSIWLRTKTPYLQQEIL